MKDHGVIPRFWFLGEDFDKGTRRYKVTLDNTDEDYIFAFDIKDSELIKDLDLPRKRLIEAAQILVDDYRKRHGGIYV